MDDLFDQLDQEFEELIEDEVANRAPGCGLYIILSDFSDVEKLKLQLAQALHAANRFSTYAINRHVVEYRPSGTPSYDDARAFCELSQRNGFIFLVSDDASFARQVGADGVLCSSVKKCSDARKTLDEDKIIGLRASSRAIAQSAMSLELDFVSLYSADKGDSLLDMLNWWTTSTETPVAVEGAFDQENCAPYVAAGATFLDATHHIWTHPSKNPMQGIVNMLDGFERHGHKVNKRSMN